MSNVAPGYYFFEKTGEGEEEQARLMVWLGHETYGKETNKEKIKGLCVGCVEDCVKGAGHYLQKLLTEPSDDQEKQAEKEKEEEWRKKPEMRLALTEQFPTEEDILLKQEIPMRELLGNEAAETLLTYFTAPHISLPLVFAFFAVLCLCKIESKIGR